MQFEEFDSKIKEAAEHHHPAYEEKAWEKMETLLDKHMPVEKDDRRRIVFFILFFLLGGLGVYLGISKPWQQKKNFASSTVAPVIEKDVAPATKNLSGETPGTAAKTYKDADLKKDELSDETNTKDVSTSATTSLSEIKPKKLADKKPVAEKSLTHKEDVSSSKNNLTNNNNTITFSEIASNGVKQKSAQKPNRFDLAGKNIDGKLPNNSSKNNQPQAEPVLNATATVEPAAKKDKTDKNSTTADPGIIIKNDSVSKPKTNDIVKEDSDKKKEEVAQKNQKPGKPRRSAFAITFSVGPDLSAVGISRIGSVRPVYGAGLSYSFNKVTIRSGFYLARKVYTAGPDDYHTGYPLPTNIKLTKVDADCKLYEIPLSLAYSISSSKKENWFVSAGASSFLMKKENYGYYYKNTTTGQDWSRDWSLKNGENHIFSILDLSAGYERKINKTFSIIAEPYLKVPLDGVGFGSIRLNSAGVLFTLSVKPFANKK